MIEFLLLFKFLVTFYCNESMKHFVKNLIPCIFLLAIRLYFVGLFTPGERLDFRDGKT